MIVRSERPSSSVRPESEFAKKSNGDVARQQQPRRPGGARLTRARELSAITDNAVPRRGRAAHDFLRAQPRTSSFSFFTRARGGAERRRRGESVPRCGSGRRLFFLMNSPVAAALSGTGSASPRGDRNNTGMGARRVPPLYPLTRAHEGRAALSAVDSATRWGRLLAAVADSILEKMRIPVGGERWSSGVRGDRSCGRRRAPAATGRKANARHQKISGIGGAFLLFIH
jgi:hypothetical protein